jgi:hypothetical protein
MSLKKPSNFPQKTSISDIVTININYQLDYLINSPIDYLVLINIRTLFVALESIANQTTTSILDGVKSILKRLKIKSLESDEEEAFVSK